MVTDPEVYVATDSIAFFGSRFEVPDSETAVSFFPSFVATVRAGVILEASEPAGTDNEVSFSLIIEVVVMYVVGARFRVTDSATEVSFFPSLVASVRTGVRLEALEPSGTDLEDFFRFFSIIEAVS